MARIKVQNVELINGEAHFDQEINERIWSVTINSNRGFTTTVDAHGDASEDLFDKSFARVITIDSDY